MALTVPASSLSEFGWIFSNNHLDSSIYQDDDIMEFSSSSGEECLTPPHNGENVDNSQQSAQQVSSKSMKFTSRKNSQLIFGLKLKASCHSKFLQISWEKQLERMCQQTAPLFSQTFSSRTRRSLSALPN